ncbi:Protein N-acetyltransferase, RimJ/RimL family [Sphingomonas guangdongensis]|uniref:Protein N-acetyltransferase, RimJ/RimL family n=1 Tax=Sphingomonas guangdongensis TaxID=1141890 RepID=A0A285QYC8_9SPHN|nr:GNAT family N-acetyltransferase [Sphingomonas guangdongensis]SOB86923.1 Protein N-acetyltransferase, RimJ/RimL family [Sphingomonas guangdongensis]
MFARTPRLTLRPGWIEDAPALAQAIAHEAVVMRLAHVPWPYTVADAEHFLSMLLGRGEAACLVFAHDGGTTLVGGVGVHGSAGAFELGYWFTPAAWGRGYATEAGRAMLGMARHALGHRALASGHQLDNPASGRVLRKLGFVPTGRVERRACRARGCDVEVATYACDLTDAACDPPRMAA